LDNQTNISYKNCLTKDALLNYMSGKLTVADCREVELHITNCLLCGDAVEGLYQLSDIEREQLLQKINLSNTTKVSNPIKKFKVYWAAAALALLVGSIVIYDAMQPDKEIVIAKNEKAKMPTEVKLQSKEDAIQEPAAVAHPPDNEVSRITPNKSPIIEAKKNVVTIPNIDKSKASDKKEDPAPSPAAPVALTEVKALAQEDEKSDIVGTATNNEAQNEIAAPPPTVTTATKLEVEGVKSKDLAQPSVATGNATTESFVSKKSTAKREVNYSDKQIADLLKAATQAEENENYSKAINLYSLLLKHYQSVNNTKGIELCKSNIKRLQSLNSDY
jgi:hypothetical protein